ncbi:hypothetical protein EXN66_Car009577 [Channa argus]|uniref:Uncharacterized protein n=1 Tax=Channa argus TaxID=215402 RepID=A0A6G1PU88_CHAAH|nr:hypothetical protein EXN66_Car009577 [Channa argus]
MSLMAVQSNNFKDGSDKIGVNAPIFHLPLPLLISSSLLSLLDKGVLMKRESERRMEPEEFKTGWAVDKAIGNLLISKDSVSVKLFNSSF